VEDIVMGVTAPRGVTADPAATGSTRFARVVFTIAGIWGVVLMTPLYFAFDAISRAYPPPITHPDLYYGFVGVTLAWQMAFLVIASNPTRYRTIMLAAILEKLIYVATMVVLYLKGQISAGQLAVIPPDATLGLLFVAAFFKTPAFRSGPRVG
jgi:hypothetical protein